MNASDQARMGGFAPRMIARPYNRPLILLLSLAPLLALAACAPPITPYAGANPSDASAPVRAAVYRSVTDRDAGARPGEAQDWKQRNELITPEQRQ